MECKSKKIHTLLTHVIEIKEITMERTTNIV